MYHEKILYERCYFCPTRVLEIYNTCPFKSLNDHYYIFQDNLRQNVFRDANTSGLILGQAPFSYRPATTSSCRALIDDREQQLRQLREYS